MGIGYELAILYSFMALASLAFLGWLVKIAWDNHREAQKAKGELKELREARLHRGAPLKQTDGDSHG